MGAINGHMLHPYELFNNRKDIKKFFKNVIKGKYNLYEKVDGINLYIVFDANGNHRFARNKTEKPWKDPFKRFGKYNPIVHSIDNLCVNFVNSLSTDSYIRKQLANKALNIEIIDRKNSDSIVNYDRDAVCIHSIHYDKSKNYEFITCDIEKHLKIGGQITNNLKSSIAIKNKKALLPDDLIHNEVGRLSKTVPSKRTQHKKFLRKEIDEFDKLYVDDKEFVEEFGEYFLKNFLSKLKIDKLSNENDVRNIEGLCVDVDELKKDFNNLNVSKNLTNKVKITGKFVYQHREKWYEYDHTFKDIKNTFHRLLLSEFGIENRVQIYKNHLANLEVRTDYAHRFVQYAPVHQFLKKHSKIDLCDLNLHKMLRNVRCHINNCMKSMMNCEQERVLYRRMLYDFMNTLNTYDVSVSYRGYDNELLCTMVFADVLAFVFAIYQTDYWIEDESEIHLSQMRF